MYDIHVHVDIAAPIDAVFEAVSDYEHFFRGPTITRAKVTTPGRDEKNGLGAIREIDADGHHFVEEIVGFDRPRRLDYLVRTVSRGGRRLPMKHEAGWLELSERDGRTRVDWRSRFRIAIPVVGRFVERAMGPKAAGAFQQLLEQAKADLERSAGAAAE